MLAFKRYSKCMTYSSPSVIRYVVFLIIVLKLFKVCVYLSSHLDIPDVQLYGQQCRVGESDHCIASKTVG